MLNYEFVCWLEGYFDLCPEDRLDRKKLRILRNHLNLVKAVEGELGPLNTNIYDTISKYLDDEKLTEEEVAASTHILRPMLQDFLQANYG